MLELRVDDSGSGIAEDIRDKMFEPFVSSKRTVGVGMGLTVARHSLRSVGGEVTLASRKEGGSSAILVHPVRDPRQRERAPRGRRIEALLTKMDGIAFLGAGSMASAMIEASIAKGRLCPEEDRLPGRLRCQRAGAVQAHGNPPRGILPWRALLSEADALVVAFEAPAAWRGPTRGWERSRRDAR